jgi:hypothetical protein
MPKSDYTAFDALDPFFDVVMEGLTKFVDGEHYFDTLADDVLFEFLYEFAGRARYAVATTSSRSMRDMGATSGSTAATR